MASRPILNHNWVGRIGGMAGKLPVFRGMAQSVGMLGCWDAGGSSGNHPGLRFLILGWGLARLARSWRLGRLPASQPASQSASQVGKEHHEQLRFTVKIRLRFG